MVSVTCSAEVQCSHSGEVQQQQTGSVQCQPRTYEHTNRLKQGHDVDAAARRCHALEIATSRNAKAATHWPRPGWSLAIAKTSVRSNNFHRKNSGKTTPYCKTKEEPREHSVMSVEAG
jgi:hypothetical protein